MTDIGAFDLRKAYAASRKNKELARERDKGKCIVCGEPVEEIHHVVSLLKSHDNSVDNLVCLCHKHHQIAHGDTRQFVVDCRKSWNPRQRLIGYCLDPTLRGSKESIDRAARPFFKAYAEAEKYSEAVYQVTGKFVRVQLAYNPELRYMALLIGRYTNEELIYHIFTYGAWSKKQTLGKHLGVWDNSERLRNVAWANHGKWYAYQNFSFDVLTDFTFGQVN